MILGLAAPAAGQTPPWALESPRAAGAAYGLGLDWLFERQESLQVEESSSSESPPDIDLRWELTGPAVQVPIALPSLGGLYPSLVLRAASADVTVDSPERPEDEVARTSFDGRGTLLGATFDLAGSLCPGCPWFASGRYGFEDLSELEADGTTPFSFGLPADEIRLARRTHELSTRVGYVFPGGRAATYFGARGRRTEVDIEEELRLPQSERTITTDTRLESEEVQGFAGIDAHLAGPLFGRVEGSFGADDRAFLVKLVYLPRISLGKLRPQRAAELQTELGEVHAEFESEMARLAGMPEAAALVAAHELLRRLEAELLAAFAGSDFAAMRDYVQERFAHARGLLPPATSAAAARRHLAPAVHAVYRHASPAPPFRLAQQPAPRSWLSDLEGFLGPILERLDQLGADNDWYVDVCVRSQPQTEARVTIQPRRYAPGAKTVRRTDRVVAEVPRGLYVYRLSRGGLDSDCRPGSGRFDARRCPEPLDLVDPDRPAVVCELEADFAACLAEETDRETCGAR